MNKGKIVQIMGPVVDVKFDGELPKLKDALEVTVDGKTLVMEVAQHIGSGMVRCIMLAASEGLYKDLEVTATGKAISVPVGKDCWADFSMLLVKPLTDLMICPVRNTGRFIAVLPDLRSRAQALIYLKQVSRLSICLRLTQRAARSVCSAVPA